MTGLKQIKTSSKFLTTVASKTDLAYKFVHTPVGYGAINTLSHTMETSKL